MKYSKSLTVLLFVMFFALFDSVPALAAPVDKAVSYADTLNKTSWLIVVLGGLIALGTTGAWIKTILQIVKKERTFNGNGFLGVQTFLFSLLMVGALGYGIYQYPIIFLEGVTWSDLYAVEPTSVTASWAVMAGAILSFYLYYLTMQFFPKEHDRPVYLITMLGLVSGSAYALNMFIVNTAIKSEISKAGLGGFFVLCFLFYVFGQKFVRAQLTILTNNMLYSKRVELITKILKTPFYKKEGLGDEKIYTALNNDTETISASIGVFVVGATSLVTILISFLYLALSNIFGLITSAIMVLIAASLLMIANRSANRLFTEARDTQNLFFRFINDMVHGFKELYLNKVKRQGFQADMIASVGDYRTKRIKAELVSANLYFISELLVYSVLFGLLFVLPVVIPSITNVTLSDYVVVFLFLKGPIDNVMNSIPRVTQFKISWNRIQEISDQIKRGESDKMELEFPVAEEVKFELQGVEFQYKTADDQTFGVGPIDYEFESGEVVFITGGNGSGKSTLAKLITGLYAPDGGQVRVNGQVVDAENLGQYFSTVFTDYYLFEKLYGIDYDKERARIDQYIRLLEIDEKLSVKDGMFSTTRLSTGQKKRLALLIAYLEDRPVVLFDEWAADQDPEFRGFFYQELLPEMKARGKLVIAITHDDRYFHLADKVIKMESGQIQQEAVAVS